VPPFLPFLWVGVVLAVLGWGGLAALVFLTLPYLGPRWLFFFLVNLAVCGTVLPLVHYLHRRFPSSPPVDSAVIVREALMVGIYCDLLVWLQLGRVLNPLLALFLAAGMVIVEFLLRLRERSRWKPQETTHERT